MANYDYGNARLRAMKSRLLTKAELHSLAKSGSLEGLISALTHTAYHKAVETALAHTTGMNCITVALRNDLIQTLGKAHSFFDDETQPMIAITLRNYDIDNLRAILRGLSQHVSPGEILSALMPVGELGQVVLDQLARAPGLRACIDLMATMNLPFAQPLLRLRIDQSGAEVQDMEMALEKWHFTSAMQYLAHQPGNGEPLLSAIKINADLVNLLFVLRFVHNPAERKLLEDKRNNHGIDWLFVGPGFLPFEALAQTVTQENIASVVEMYAGSRYDQALRKGLEVYAQSGRISAIENSLSHDRLIWLSRLISTDPLGIGVLLGYAALKVSEIRNLRWIAHSIDLRLSVKELTKELEFVE